MFNKILSVTYIDTKNCFCALPVNIANAKPQTFVRLTYGENKATYLSTAANQFILQQNSIGIPTLLARLLGIEENSEISVIEVAHMPDVTALTISPLKKDDFEVLEAFAQNIQSTLLDQIKVVHLNQPIVIWIGSHISVNVLINAVEPISPGCLCNLSEVTIKDPNLQTLASQNRAKLQHMKHFLKNLDRNLNNSSNTFIKLFAHNSRCSLTARLVPLADLKLPADKIFPFNVYISKRNFNEEFLKAKPHLCRISTLNANLGIDSTDCCVQLCFLEDCNLPSQENDFLYVSEELLQKLWCNYFSRVAFQTIQTASFVNEIQVVAKRTCLNRNQVLEEFKKYIADNTNNNDIVVLNADVVCNFGKFVRCSLKFLPDNYKYCIADDEFVRNCKFSLHVDHYESPPALQSITNDLKYSETCNFGDIIQNVMFNFANRADFENVLITGKAGTGKSVLCKVLEGKLKEFPLYIYTERINCKEVKGKTVESLFKILACTFAKLVLHQPSCLILDDLHVLCEVVNGDELSTPNSLYFNRLSETLNYFLSNMVEFNAIRVLATAESCAKLNRNIYTSRGDHLFKNVFDIEELNKADRSKFLEHYFTTENTLDAIKLNFEEIALKTDSFVAQDLICLAEKTIFEALKENPNGNSSIEMHHFENAFKTFNILALTDVNLSSAGTKTFEDIGGLADIKKVLVETLIWPVKYSSVFAEAPLRLQSGLLLYGPPGTGKTLLAGAAAKHCGLRLISIKGPELLSKYIGASEQAVRDVFEKAQSAKPCILFFDEFDSLAPRRGHDNTGVTDRVVNQLLTQLDGVESLTGVCILAATSRPDLLDPALLRPGRLDRQLLCPIPDYHTRIEILKVLTKTIELEEDVDFEKIASLTEGFSGADLQGVLYVTQVSSVDLLSNDRDSKTFRLSQDILEKTVQSTRPSLTHKDKLRYETIYSKFQGGTSLDDFKSGTKSTLA